MAIAVTTPQAAPRRRALSAIKTGVQQTPLRVLIYGAEKVGKSTFAAGAPKPIFLGSDSGTERLDVARMQPESWAEALGFVQDIASEKHDYQTLVVDPVGWLEPLAFEHITGPGGNIDRWDGGYGKGYTAALSLWREFLAGLEKAWKRGMHVVIVGHAQVKSFQNPEGLPYDRYELVLHAKAAGLLRQWVDVVGYANLEISAKKRDGETKAKAIFTGARLLHTAPCAAYDAGSRISLPEEMPLGWDSLATAVKGESERAAELVTLINEQSARLGDEGVTKRAAEFVATHNSNANKLSELSNYLESQIKKKETITNV